MNTPNPTYVQVRENGPFHYLEAISSDGRKIKTTCAMLDNPTFAKVNKIAPQMNICKRCIKVDAIIQGRNNVSQA